MEGAAFVDRFVAPSVHKLSTAQLERTVEEARTRFDPDESEARRVAAADARCFDVHIRLATLTGTVEVTTVLDLDARAAPTGGVVIHAHVSADSPVVHVDDTGTDVLVAQLRSWCAAATRVTIKPVIDLNATAVVDAYGRFRWRTPHGLRFDVDPDGTIEALTSALAPPEP